MVVNRQGRFGIVKPVVEPTHSGPVKPPRVARNSVADRPRHLYRLAVLLGRGRQPCLCGHRVVCGTWNITAHVMSHHRISLAHVRGRYRSRRARWLFAARSYADPTKCTETTLVGVVTARLTLALAVVELLRRR